MLVKWATEIILRIPNEAIRKTLELNIREYVKELSNKSENSVTKMANILPGLGDLIGSSVVNFQKTNKLKWDQSKSHLY